MIVLTGLFFRKDEFSRKKLNLIVVLDMSGSMVFSFNRFVLYYIIILGMGSGFDEEISVSKMIVANQVLFDH